MSYVKFNPHQYHDAPSQVAQLSQPTDASADTAGVADPLAIWLALPIPDGFTEAQAFPELEALLSRLDSFLDTGWRIIQEAPNDHPRLREAVHHYEIQQARRVALGDLLGALSGQRYDRGRLARWTAAGLFLRGDMGAMLEVIDGIRERDEGDA